MEGKNKTTENSLLDVFIIIVLVALIISLYFNMKYSEELETEIKKRDSRIEYLLKNDSILHQIIDFKTDTAHNYDYYILHKRNGKTLKYNEIYKMLEVSNEQHSKDANRLSHKIDSLYKQNICLKNENLINKTILSLIKESYEIDYKLIDLDKHYKIQLIVPNKIDSALILLPYYKNKIISINKKENGDIEYTIRH